MIFKRRKSQAAMEFLMTYGWAILVVLAAIAALAYFGVLSPEKFLPEKCILAPGIACVSHKVTPTDTTLILSNGLGRTITVTNIEVGGCSKSFTTDMISGNESTFVMTSCNNGVSKDAYKGDITFKYTEKTTGLTKTVYGNIATKVE
jgi:uncharacterized protein (UPF0333 family)